MIRGDDCLHDSHDNVWPYFTSFIEDVATTVCSCKVRSVLAQESAFLVCDRYPLFVHKLLSLRQNICWALAARSLSGQPTNRIRRVLHPFESFVMRLFVGRSRGGAVKAQAYSIAHPANSSLPSAQAECFLIFPHKPAYLTFSFAINTYSPTVLLS